jgi:hypothetical protein
VLICSCTYFYFDYRKKQNENVIANIEEQGLQILFNAKVKNDVKARFLIYYERLHPGNSKKILKGLENDTLNFDISLEMFLACENLKENDSKNINPFIFEIVNNLEFVLDEIHNKSKQNTNDYFYKRFESFIRLCYYIKSNSKNHNSINNLIEKYTKILSRDYVLKKLDSNNSVFDPFILNNALDIIICSNDPTEMELIIKRISPFENLKSKKKFDSIFPKEKLFNVDYNAPISHNAGYIEMAYCYGVIGDLKKVEACLDSIYKYNSHFSKIRYNNFYNIFLSVFKNKSVTNVNNLNIILNKFAVNSRKDKKDIISSLIFQINKKFNRDFIKSQPSNRGTTILLNIDSAKTNQLFEMQENEILNVYSNLNDINFELALLYKTKGLQNGISKNTSFETLKKAFGYYLKVEDNYLKQDFILGSGDRSKEIKRFEAFLYPYKIDKDNYWNPFSSFYPDYNQSSCFDYLRFNKKFGLFFKSKEDGELIDIYLKSYFENATIYKDFSLAKIDYSIFDFVEKNLLTEFNLGGLDTNFIFLVQCNRFFEQKDTKKAYYYFNRLNKKYIQTELFQKGQRETNLQIKLSRYLIGKLSQHLSKYEKDPNLSIEFATCFLESFETRNKLLSLLINLDDENGIENTFLYLDTLQKLINKDQKIGLVYFEALGAIGGKQCIDLALKNLKDLKDERKARAFQLLVRGICKNKNYYLANKILPSYLSPTTELEVFSEIMKSEILLNKSKHLDNDNYPFRIFDERKGLQSLSDYESDMGEMYYLTGDD